MVKPRKPTVRSSRTPGSAARSSPGGHCTSPSRRPLLERRAEPSFREELAARYARLRAYRSATDALAPIACGRTGEEPLTVGGIVLRQARPARGTAPLRARPSRRDGAVGRLVGMAGRASRCQHHGRVAPEADARFRDSSGPRPRRPSMSAENSMLSGELQQVDDGETGHRRLLFVRGQTCHRLCDAAPVEPASAAKTALECAFPAHRPKYLTTQPIGAILTTLS